MAYVRGQPQTVGALAFSSKKALREYSRGIKNQYQPGQQLSPEHAAFVTALVRRHPQAAQKIGPGIRAVTVELDPYGTTCFWVHRVDGTGTDVSYRDCITPSTAHGHFADACRAEVADQILAFRSDYFAEHGDALDRVHCAITGELVTEETCHVDHQPPDTFRAILADFVREHSIAPATVAIAGDGDGEMGRRLADRQLAASWQEYHRRRAVLRVTTVAANLALREGRGPLAAVAGGPAAEPWGDIPL